MKKHIQRIFSLALALVLCLGLVTVPARADLWEGIKYNVTNVWDFLTTGTSDWNLRDSIGSYTGGTWMEKYANYVDDLITGLGTDTIGEHGYLLPVPATSHYSTRGEFIELVPGPPSVLAYRNSDYALHYMVFEGVAPVFGTYVIRSYSAGPKESDPGFFLDLPSGAKFGVPFSMLAGDAYKFEIRFKTNFGVPELIRRFTASVYLEVQPYEYTPDGFTGKHGGGFTRPGNLDTATGTDVKFGATSGDGSVSVIGNVGNLFNEGNKTYYNPQTQTYENANNWMYDYSDRSYSFDTDNGGSGKVVYGDDVATVTLKDSNGNVITYNFNYMLGEGVTPPIPGGGSGGGSGGGGDSGGGGGSGILDKLGELIGSILNGILTVLDAALGKVLDGLIALVNMVSGKLGEVVTALLSILDELPKMLEGFSGFLGAALSFLPPEITTILTFGILALVLVGVLKLFLK